MPELAADLGFGIQIGDVGFGVWAWDLGFGVEGLGVLGFAFGVSGLGFGGFFLLGGGVGVGAVFGVEQSSTRFCDRLFFAFVRFFFLAWIRCDFRRSLIILDDSGWFSTILRMFDGF